MMWKSAIAMCATLLVGVMLVQAAEKPQGVAKIGAPAPLFSLPDQNGKTVNLADFSGKIVVLEWWNNECPVVQRHYKANTMNSLVTKYKDKDVVWLAINSTNGKTNADNKKAGDAWTMDRPILNDSPGDVGHAYGATNTPGMYVIDKQGVLAYMGAIDDDTSGKNGHPKNYVSQAIDQLLAGQSVSEPQTKQYGCSVKYAK
jgi:peroxiredoxin